MQDDDGGVAAVVMMELGSVHGKALSTLRNWREISRAAAAPQTQRIQATPARPLPIALRSVAHWPSNDRRNAAVRLTRDAFHHIRKQVYLRRRIHHLR